MTSEEIFIQSIDCRFPYHDLEVAESTIIKASKISDEAQFAVLHELVRIPKSMSVSIEEQIALITLWEKYSNSPLKPTIVPLLLENLISKKIDSNSVLNAMNKIQQFRNSYFALNIVSSLILSDEIEEKYEEIEVLWRKDQQ